MRRESRKWLGYWLLSIVVFTAVMVMIGGITRLTGSGLSMVQWQPFLGVLPPLSAMEWDGLFLQYQQFPEYQLLNADLDLAGFKRLFFWEYLHRVLGRVTGLVVILPFIWAWIRGQLSDLLKRDGILLSVLVSAQGIMGWYMVKSGLIDVPAVSHFRLAAHLILAFVLGAYALIVYMRECHSELINVLDLPQRMRSISCILLVLTTVQVIYGAFVAGLKAGLLSPTFPKMNGQWLPDILFVLSPAWQNAINNPFAIQYIHRVLGVSIFLLVMGLLIWVWRAKLPSFIVLQVFLLAALVMLQFWFGIATLLLGVPIQLALMHQFTGYLCFLSVAALYFSVRR